MKRLFILVFALLISLSFVSASISLSSVSVKKIDTRVYNISWQASSNLNFSVFLSDGVDENIIGDYITSRTFIANLPFASAGDYKIIVRASRESESTEGESAFFSVEEGEPFAKISIVNNSVFSYGENIIVSGFAYDSESGFLNDFSWKLNSRDVGNEKDIILENLDIGNYILELEAQDSQGNTAQDNVNFIVDSITEPDVSIKSISVVGDKKMNQTHYIISEFFNIRAGTFCNISVYGNELLIYEEEAEIPANSYYRVYAQWFPQKVNNTIRVEAVCAGETNIQNNNKIIIFQVVDPSRQEINKCMNLNESRKTYFLNSSIVNNTIKGNCMNIAAENITLDCQGNIISSNSANVGIYSNKRGTSIKNCNISLNLSSSTGIKLERADNSNIFGNILNSKSYGLYINYVSNSTIENNIITYGGNGIYVYSGAGNILLGNNLSNNKNYGIWIYFSPNSQLRNNVVINSSYGIWNYYSPNSLIINNLANSNMYGIWNYNSANSSIAGNTAGNSIYGVWNFYSSNSLIINNLARNNTYGIWNYNSQNSSIINNIAINNKNYGIWNYFSPNSSIINNTAGNSIYGVWNFYSSNSLITNNLVNNNTYGIWSYFSPNSLITNNKVSNSVYSIWNFYSQNSSIINNTASKSMYGIYVSDFYASSAINISNNLACNNSYRDMYCYYSNITGTGNIFGKGKVQACNGQPSYPQDYGYC